MSDASAPALPAPCACGRDATLGRRTCARCRCVTLGARLSPADRFDRLPEDIAPIVERSLLDAEAALLRARAAAAASAGVPTVDAPVPGEHAVTRTFAACAPLVQGPVAHLPTMEVRRG